MSTDIRNRDAASIWRAVTTLAHADVAKLLEPIETGTIEARIASLTGTGYVAPGKILEVSRLRAELIRRAAMPVKESDDPFDVDPLAEVQKSANLARYAAGNPPLPGTEHDERLTRQECEPPEMSEKDREETLDIMRKGYVAIATSPEALSRPPLKDPKRRFAYLEAVGAPFVWPDIIRPRGAELEEPRPWADLCYAEQRTRIATELAGAREVLNRSDAAQRIALARFSDLQIESAVHDAIGRQTRHRRDSN